MEIKYRKLSDLHPNPKNPRRGGVEAVQKLADSIKANPAFFEARPILLSDRTGELVIIGGERRSEAALLLGMTEVPTILMSGLTEAQEDEIMIRDNTHAGVWDEKKLQAWGKEQLQNWSVAGVNWEVVAPEEKEEETLDDKYSENVGTIIYEPKNTAHKISDLYEMTPELDEVVAKVKNKELRQMLELRKAWFCDFNFAKIADYYAYQATPEEQRAFERLGLILLDRDQLIENGFAEIKKDFGDETNH